MTVPLSADPPTMAVPRRRGLNAVQVGAAILLGAALAIAFELVLGTSFEFAGMVGLYVVATALAVRAAGGARSIFGLMVAYYSGQQVFVSQAFKALLHENPERNLWRPIPTMGAEILTMLGFALGAVLVSKIRPNRDRPLFEPNADLGWLRQLAIAATLLSIVRIAITTAAGNADLGGGGVNPLRQIAIIDPLAVSCAVAVAVIESRGKRLTSPLVWMVIVPLIVFNLVFGVRQAIVAAVGAIFVAGWAFGYRFKPKHFVLAAGLGYLFFFIVSPFSLAIRGETRGGSEGSDFGRQYNKAFDLLGDVVVDPMKYQETPQHVLELMPKENFTTLYYDGVTPFGPISNIIERFALVKTTDVIVDDTLKSGTIGWTNITPAVASLLPNFVGIEKDLRSPGNKLAHRVRGLVNPGDFVTPITVGVTADAFSAFGYLGCLLAPAALLAVMIVVYRLLIRPELANNVYAPAILISFYHPFSEQPIGGIMPIALYNPFIVTIAFFLATRAASLLNFRYLRPTSPAGDVGADAIPMA